MLVTGIIYIFTFDIRERIYDKKKHNDIRHFQKAECKCSDGFPGA